jgi:predicted metalloprotease with PDZ domain
LEAKITVVSLAPPRVRVEGRRTGGAKSWSFRQSYAGITLSADRLENLALKDESGAAVPVRKLAPGEFEAERAATAFSYEVKLDPPSQPSSAAHLSWLAADYGVLMPGDLLPLPATSASLRFNLPPQWTLASAESPTATISYIMMDAEDSIFFVGRNLRRQQSLFSRSMLYSFATTGDWAFTDEEAAGAAAAILKEHANILGGAPDTHVLVVLAPFPVPASAQMWSAETRGRTVFLLSGRWPSKTTALAQLNVPLTHELLHLWVPNALALDGEYDWFYEGFTVYQSVRVGVRLSQLSFDDYLNALGRAFDNYRAARGGEELSLLDASERRWAGGAGLVYNKGMLVAFLYDLTLSLQTSNKDSLDDVYRELFRRYRSEADRRSGNDALIELLSSMRGMQSFTERYVRSADALKLAPAVEPFGLQVEPIGARTRLVVARSLSRPQRELLRKLGYNEKRRAS